MKVYGRSAVSEFLGDRIVYRGLVPVDIRLPSLKALRRQTNLPERFYPRKSDPEYARVVAHILRQARHLEAPRVALKKLVLIGDTRVLDASAFDNICQAGNWPGVAFIGSETADPPGVKLEKTPGGETVCLSNRWSALNEATNELSGIPSFPEFCAARDFLPDESTVLLVDLDKTAIGARGRNAGVIDQARVQAIEQTVSSLLADSFDPVAFRIVYDRLNQPEYHSFTADNQDYLAYICLILGSSLFQLNELLAAIHSGQLRDFQQFISLVESRKSELPSTLRDIHEEIYANVIRGDPTPFKPFRYNEYKATIGRMGHLPDDTPLSKLLAEEILITQEVQTLALSWQAQGTLVFGLSDKPDEASLPTAELAAQGYLPLHRKETHAVGV